MMTDDLLEHRLRESLEAAASTVADTEPPVLPDHLQHTVTGAARRSMARPLALVACLLAIGGLSIAALRDGSSDALQVTGTADTAAASSALVPEGLQLLGTAEAGVDRTYELWAYRDRGAACVVETEVVRGERRLASSDCPRLPICIDPAWSDVAWGARADTDPVGVDCDDLTTVPTLGPGSEGGWEFVHGGLATSSADSLPGTPMRVVARVDPRVATWETSGEQPHGPFAVVAHPDDADRRYLFGVVPRGAQDTMITLRDASGGFLSEVTLSR